MNDSGIDPRKDEPREDRAEPRLTPEQYLKISEIFSEAVALEPAERRPFLCQALGGDQVLVREAESLLAAEEQAGSFLEDPAIDELARDLANERLTGILGQQLGRYHIEELLGVGGAGAVYLAKDPTLNRKVAIKILFRKYLEDRSLLHRFQQEAMAASALNHPNILTIYEIGEADGQHFIVTEFVDGTTLRKRIGDRGMPLEEIEAISLQICRALKVAHARGIVHRDLKPENVMVRTDGLVKVLDFGLAKLMSGRDLGAGGTEDDGRSHHIEGTLAYMSPEQIRGERIDRRTDIYSFGVLLYEMSSGRVPFRGAGTREILASVLEQTPAAVSRTRPEFSRKLDAVIERAMARSAEDRYATIKELRRDLLDVGRGGRRPSVPAVSRAGGFLRPRFLVGAAVVLVTILTLIWSWRGDEETSAITTRLADATFTQLTSDLAMELYPTFSPDGKTLFYASDRTGNWDIYRRPIGENTLIDLTADCPGDDRQPAISPDGSTIAFRSERDGGGIFLMDINGDDVRRLTDEGNNPAWAPDGTRIAYTIAEALNPNERGDYPSALYTIDLRNGMKRLITLGDATQASWSPSGARIAYWGIHKGGQRDLWTIPAEGGEPEPLTDDKAVDWDPVWSPGGRFLYFASNRAGSMNLWRIRLNERTGKALSRPEPITLPTSASWYASFSGDGHQMAYVQCLTRTNIAEMDFSASTGQVVGRLNWLTLGNVATTNPDVSSDGDSIVYDSIGGDQEDLYLLHDGSEIRRLTNDSYKDRAPRLQPDGDRILFFSDRSGRYGLWTIRRDGTDLQPMPRTSGPGAQISIWSPDGTSILANRQSGPPLLYSRTPDGMGWQSRRLPEPPGHDMLLNSWSPDGQKVAGFGSGISVFSFKTGLYEKLTDFGQRPVWLSDSRRLLFCSRGRLYLIDSVTHRVTQILSVEPLHFQSLAISQDRRRIYASLETREADIWVAQVKD